MPLGMWGKKTIGTWLYTVNSVVIKVNKNYSAVINIIPFDLLNNLGKWTSSSPFVDEEGNTQKFGQFHPESQ